MKRISAYFFVILLTFSITSYSVEARSETDARKFVDNIAGEALGYIRDNNLSDEEKEQKLTKLFDAHVDTQWMGKFVLGKYYRTATDEQKKKYAGLYHAYLLKSYVPKFRTYTGENITIQKVFQEDSANYLVQTVIERQGDQPEVRVDYRLQRNGKGKLQIIDIIGEGVSLITTQRSDFAGLISRKGLDYFLDRLSEKVQKM
ncbi:MAG: ABC transporter substrate-binding protein [Hyphomicrobiales bacterium]|nr:ABC transporter substrate-binding protein [Hyphomicrobiales bacterium]